MDNGSLLPGQGYNPARGRRGRRRRCWLDRGGLRCRSWNCRRPRSRTGWLPLGRSRDRPALCCRGSCCDHRCRWTRRRSAARLRLCLFALQNGLQRIARLRDPGQVERRSGICLRSAGSPGAAILKVIADLLRLIRLDRTRVRLRLGHADRRQSVQYGPALDLKLSCKIVDSNFAHPSLFFLPRR
jgi:hypothetical protein